MIDEAAELARAIRVHIHGFENVATEELQLWRDVLSFVEARQMAPAGAAIDSITRLIEAVKQIPHDALCKFPGRYPNHSQLCVELWDAIDTIERVLGGQS